MNCDFILRLKIDVRKVEFLRKPVNIADMLKRCFIYNDSLRAGSNFLELCIKVRMKGEDLVFRIKLIFYDAFDLSCDLFFFCLIFGLLLVLTQCMVLGAIWGSKHFFLLLIKHGKQILSKKIIEQTQSMKVALKKNTEIFISNWVVRYHFEKVRRIWLRKPIRKRFKNNKHRSST